VGDDFVRGGQEKTPTPQKRNSYERTVVKADTPTAAVTEGNEQYYAPWIVESPGGTLTTSAYKDGKKRCLSVERGSGDPRRKVYEQNKTFTRASSKIGQCLSEDEIRAEAHKREKEMRGAARAAEMAEEEVALEKLKGLAEKAAARKAVTGQAGTVKRAAVEAARKASTGQAGTVKRAAVEAARWVATGQAGKDKHGAREAKRGAATGQANKDKHAAVEGKRRAATGQADKDKHAGAEATRWANKKGCSGYGAQRSGREAAPIEAGATRALCTSHPQDPRDARRGLVRRGGSQAQRFSLPRGERAYSFVRARIFCSCPNFRASLPFVRV
jgi:hypothetical protein